MLFNMALQLANFIHRQVWYIALHQDSTQVDTPDDPTRPILSGYCHINSFTSRSLRSILPLLCLTDVEPNTRHHAQTQSQCLRSIIRLFPCKTTHASSSPFVKHVTALLNSVKT